MTTGTADLRARRRARREEWIARNLENGRRAAECAAVGLLWTAFSLPVVTAGAAWLAAATVFDRWTREEEPPLLATFVAAMRVHLRAGLLAQVTLVAIAAVGYFDIHVAGAAQVFAARLEMVAVALIAAAAAGLVLLALADRAHAGGGVRDSLRGASALAGAAPWALPLVVFAAAVCAALVAIIPALVLVVAGPMAYAVSVVHARARRVLDPEPDAARPVPESRPAPGARR